jgi:two-component system, OmpR family, sensor kinase
VMVMVAAGLSAWVSRRALAPVANMARTADEWSEHDLGRRFELGPPVNEIAALGHTLDALLEKVSSAIRSEQILTSELAHELRTPLAAIQGAADLAVLHRGLPSDIRDDIEEIRAGSRRMGTTITGLLALARSESTMAEGASTVLVVAVGDVLAGLELAPDAVAVDVPGDLRVPAPLNLVVRALAPILENAAKAGPHVQIVARTAGSGWVAVEVSDDGPGVRVEDADAIFDTGHTSGSTGAGLGLALARRIARSVGGEVSLVHPSSPTLFRLVLPADVTLRAEPGALG